MFASGNLFVIVYLPEDHRSDAVVDAQQHSTNSSERFIFVLDAVSIIKRAAKILATKFTN
jgi:hypothetical protein